MTVDEMKVVITADNSDVKKKINDLNGSISDFQRKIRDSLSLNQKHEAEKQELLLKQLNEKEFLRRKFYESMLMSQEDFLREKHALKVDHLAQKNALVKEHLNERTAAKELQLIERNAKRQQVLAEKTRLKQLKQNELKGNLARKGIGNLVGSALGTASIGQLLGTATVITAAITAARATIETVKNGIKEATNAIEAESTFYLSLGKQAENVREWSEKISESLGLNAVEVRKETAQIYHMVRSMKIAEGSAINMAKGVELLSKDIAAYQHLDQKQVYDRITAGLMGQTRGLHMMGYAVTQANVKQYAYTHGIAEMGKELTEQQKVVARYLLLMEQTQQTHGKLANSINSVANQTMMLKANQEALSRSLGELFIPILNIILPRLIAFTKIMKLLVDETKKLFGIKSSSEVAKELTKNQVIGMSVNEELEKSSDNANDLAKNLKKATKEAKAQLAAFDEMNVIDKKIKTPELDKTPSYGGTFGFPIDDYTNEIQNAIDNADNQANTIFEKWKSRRDKIRKESEEDLARRAESLQNFIDTTKNAIERTKGKIANLETPKWDQGIENASQALQKFEEQRQKSLNESQKPTGLNGQPVSENPIGLPDPNKLNSWQELIKRKKEEIATWFKEMPYKVQEGITDSSNKIETWFNQSGSKISTWFNTKKQEITTWSQETGDKISGGFQKVSEKMSEKGSEIKNWLAQKKEEIRNWSQETGDKIGEGISKISNKLSEKGSEIKTWLATKKQELITWSNETGEKIGNFFAKLTSIIWNSITQTFEKIKNWIAEKWTALTNLISGKSSSSSTSYSGGYNAPYVPIRPPKFATGGIVNHPTIAQIGEAGREAVVPLENNTGWIDMLASRLNGNSQPTSITVKIGEETLITKVIDGINNKTMEFGRGLVMV